MENVFIESYGIAKCITLISNDSTCQFHYKVNTCFRPYKRSGLGLTSMNVVRAGTLD